MVKEEVGPDDVADVVSAWTGIPAGRLLEGETGKLLRMESELGRSTWFAGEAFTAADIQMSFPVEAAAARGGLDASRPKLWAYLQRIHARPAYQRALQKGGPFELMR